MIVGVKVRLGHQMVGDDPEPALRLAREAAERLGLPLMVHVIDMRRPVSLAAAVPGRGRHRHALLPRQRGRDPRPGRARLDPARGQRPGSAGSCSTSGTAPAVSPTAWRGAAFAQDFPPDTISSDLHAHNVAGPVFDQATTLSKLLHCGMRLAEVITAATAAPGAAIRRGREIGSLAPGAWPT